MLPLLRGKFLSHMNTEVAAEGNNWGGGGRERERDKMVDISGEKVHNTEYQASLETDQVRKLHEAKQRVLTGLQFPVSALPFFLSAKTTIKGSDSTST